MNWDQVAGSLKQIKGRSMQLWCGITHDEYGAMLARHLCIDGRIQCSKGINSEEEEDQLDEWMSEHQLLPRPDKH